MGLIQITTKLTGRRPTVFNYTNGYRPPLRSNAVLDVYAMPLIEVSDAESATILRLRATVQQKSDAEKLRIKAMELSAKFSEWMFCLGRYPSYSAFRDEFGYCEPDAGVMYRLIERIRDSLRDI